MYDILFFIHLKFTMGPAALQRRSLPNGNSWIEADSILPQLYQMIYIYIYIYKITHFLSCVKVYIIVAAEGRGSLMVTHLNCFITADIYITSTHTPLARISHMGPHNCKEAGKLSF